MLFQAPLFLEAEPKMILDAVFVVSQRFADHFAKSQLFDNLLQRQPAHRGAAAPWAVGRSDIESPHAAPVGAIELGDIHHAQRYTTYFEHIVKRGLCLTNPRKPGGVFLPRNDMIGVHGAADAFIVAPGEHQAQIGLSHGAQQASVALRHATTPPSPGLLHAPPIRYCLRTERAPSRRPP